MKKIYTELIEKARLYGSKNEWDEAIKYFLHAFEIQKEVGDVVDLALAYLEINDINNFTATIKDAIEMKRDHYKVFLGLCIYNEKIGKYDMADEFLSKCFTILPHIPYKELSDIYYYKGLLNEYKTGNINESLFDYINAVEYNQRNYLAHFKLSIIYAEGKHYEKAIEELKLVLKFDKTIERVSYNLGVYYEELKEYKQALLAYLDEAKKENPYPYCYYNVALLYKNYENDLDKAIFYNKKALELLINDASVWYNLACCYVLKKDFQNASDCFFGAFAKDINLIDYIKTDEEVVGFLDSIEFKNLLKKFL